MRNHVCGQMKITSQFKKINHMQIETLCINFLFLSIMVAYIGCFYIYLYIYIFDYVTKMMGIEIHADTARVGWVALKIDTLMVLLNFT